MSTVLSRFRLGTGLLLVAALTSLATACSSDSANSDTPSTTSNASSSATSGEGTPAGGQGESSELDGKAFVATAIGGGPSIAAGSEIVLTFVDGRISVNAGCNTMLGDVTLSGGKLETGPMASTMMACEQPLMDQDQWLTAFFESAPAWTLEGDVLKMDSGSQSITFEE